MPYTDNTTLNFSRRWEQARNEIDTVMNEVNQCCVATGLSTGLADTAYFSTGFGSVFPTRCDLLYVVLTDFNVFVSLDGVDWFNVYDPSATGQLIPTGGILPFGGDENDVPDGWLLADGQEVAQATYPDLFALIGTVYGTASDAVNDFVLPDLRGRVPIGANNSTTTIDATYQTLDRSVVGGVEGVGLAGAENPSHVHTGNRSAVLGSRTCFVSARTGTGHAFSSAGLFSQGSGNDHDNIQPSVVVNYLIKT